jgi:hypothetical protein
MFQNGTKKRCATCLEVAAQVVYRRQAELVLIALLRQVLVVLHQLALVVLRRGAHKERVTAMIAVPMECYT